MGDKGSSGHRFGRKEIEEILASVRGKTLGEVDSRNVFAKTVNHPKITGIAGDVIEQSVLGYPANTSRDADLIIDGIDTELKVTGIRKNSSRAKGGQYEAKEPVSITAVTPSEIIHEEFLTSHFWMKCEHLLFVLYHYDSALPVTASEYRFFRIIGYLFNSFSMEDREVLKCDWEAIRDYVIDAQKYPVPEERYPGLSEYSSRLMYLDTAPKWPNRPRFRLKRSFVNQIISGHLDEGTIRLPGVHSYSDIDRKCHDFTVMFRGHTAREIAAALGKPCSSGKNINETIITGMFGVTGKLGDIGLLNKAGINCKSITLNSKGGRTEDMKLLRVDFDEMQDANLQFEDSSLYCYFAEHQFLCVFFQEPYKDAPRDENVFLGFKRYAFSRSFIEKHVRKAWDHTRNLIFTGTLKNIPDVDRYGNYIYNSLGNLQEAPNFIKGGSGAHSNYVFIRGTGSDSNHKNLVVNGVRMYIQNFWIKGLAIVEELKNLPFL